VGYGSNVNLPAFNPFYDPAYFHDCTGRCGEGGGSGGNRRAGGPCPHASAPLGCWLYRCHAAVPLAAVPPPHVPLVPPPEPQAAGPTARSLRTTQPSSSSGTVTSAACPTSTTPCPL
jgi:hypothetical protein